MVTKTPAQWLYFCIWWSVKQLIRCTLKMCAPAVGAEVGAKVGAKVGAEVGAEVGGRCFDSPMGCKMVCKNF